MDAESFNSGALAVGTDAEAAVRVLVGFVPTVLKAVRTGDFAGVGAEPAGLAIQAASPMISNKGSSNPDLDK
jgi:hypothetical protein